MHLKLVDSNQLDEIKKLKLPHKISSDSMVKKFEYDDKVDKLRKYYLTKTTPYDRDNSIQILKI